MPLMGKGYDMGKKVPRVGGNTPIVPKPPTQVGGNNPSAPLPARQTNMGGNYGGPGHKLP